MLYMIVEDFKGDPVLEWIDRWKDLVAFEVIPVVTSSEAAAAIAPRL